MSSEHENTNPISPSPVESSSREGAGVPLSRKEFIGAVGGAAAGSLIAGSGAMVAAETLKAATVVRPSAQKTIIQAMGLDIDQPARAAGRWRSLPRCHQQRRLGVYTMVGAILARVCRRQDHHLYAQEGFEV
jgi:hypothetical protein